MESGTSVPSLWFFMCSQYARIRLLSKSKSTRLWWVWPRRVTLKHVSTFCWLNPTFVKRTIFCSASSSLLFPTPTIKNENWQKRHLTNFSFEGLFLSFLLYIVNPRTSVPYHVLRLFVARCRFFFGQFLGIDTCRHRFSSCCKEDSFSFFFLFRPFSLLLFCVSTENFSVGEFHRKGNQRIRWSVKQKLMVCNIISLIQKDFLIDRTPQSLFSKTTHCLKLVTNVSFYQS